MWRCNDRKIGKAMKGFMEFGPDIQLVRGRRRNFPTSSYFLHHPDLHTSPVLYLTIRIHTRTN